MTRRRKPHGVRRFIDVLSPKAQRLLAAALFLTFAPLMVVPIESQGYRLSSVVFICCVSGLIGMSYGLTFMWTKKLLPVAIALHAMTFLGYGGVFPEWLWPRASGFSLTGLAAVILVGSAYVVFVVIIAGEGQRSVRQQAELDLATKIHSELTPPIETAGQWGLAVGRSDASNSMGGDLIDVVDHGPSMTAVLADVSGHGVRAGVVMAMVKTAFREAVASSADLPRIAQAVNRALAGLTADDVFATAWFVRIERGGTLTAVGCGHPPIYTSNAKGAIECLRAEGMPLGIAADASFPQTMSADTPAARLVLYSDGLTEAGAERGAMLGDEGLRGIIESTLHLPAAEAIEAMLNAVLRHAPADDDRSLMLIEPA
ncbi:MAG: PP2C family protein-serine/threonine phosphatase [Planctomycetota bacterium]